MSEASARMQRVFESVPGSFLVVKPDAPRFTIVAASADYLRATHTDATIFGRPLSAAFPDDPAHAGATGTANLTASLERVIATRAADTMEVQSCDARLQAADGGGFEDRYRSPVNAPILDAAGNVEYIVHRVGDAGARVNRDAIQILESIGGGLFTLDRRWRFDYVNREAHCLLGREPGDLRGRELWQVYPGLRGTEFERHLRRTMQERLRSSFTALHADRAAWHEVTAAPIAEGISVHFRDVTEQKDMQADQLRLVTESERQRSIYETALDSTPDFVYVFDLEHRFIYANQALLRMWGVADGRGKKLHDLGYEQWHIDMHDREIEAVIASSAPIRGEVPFTGTNGRRIYDYIFAPVFGRDGEVVAVAGTTRDVTERQAAEQAMREHTAQLAESDRAKDEFLATLSHELRNPLAPLRNSIELLRRAPHDARLSPVYAVMERQVNYLVRLVDDLLEVSRISRGELSLRKERVALEDVVRNALETSGPQIEAAGHELVVDLPPEPVWVNGDPVRLAQVLANLLDNAAKYTERGGHITLRARSADGWALVSVRDDGFGMEPASVPRMFQMFSRGDRDSTRSQGGLGIGLALSRRLAQMHGGTLDATSDGPGRGSEFILRVPLGAGAEPGRPVANRPDVTLASARVLVVDDNVDAAESLAVLLELLGAEVQVARSGREALDVFPAYRPDIVLLDIGMPGMNGYDVARAIRSQHADRPSRLVALTGWGQAEDRRRAREAGFDHHLVKPADIGALQRLLAALAGAGSGEAPSDGAERQLA